MPRSDSVSMPSCVVNASSAVLWRVTRHRPTLIYSWLLILPFTSSLHCHSSLYHTTICQSHCVSAADPQPQPKSDLSLHEPPNATQGTLRRHTAYERTLHTEALVMGSSAYL